jgi:FkbM family methyltransferase
MKRAETQYGVFNYFDVDSIGTSIAQGLFWEEHLRPWFDEMGPGKVFVDAGANIGFFSIYCARKGADVYAFEASPEVFSLLQKNVQENQLHNVCTSQTALFDRACSVAIMPDHEGWGGYPTLADGNIDYEKMGNAGALGLSPVGDGETRLYKMIAVPLDNFCLEKVSLLKTDVQGADLRVLHGARMTIKRCQPVILFEYEPAPSNLLGDPLESYFEFFKEMNYEVQHIHAGDFVARPGGKS